MTQREILLLRILALTGLTALGLWGAQAYFDESNRLDQRFLTLQKETSQLQIRIAQAPSQAEASLLDRFWAQGTLPEPLVLARSIEPLLAEAGVAVLDFQVVVSTPQEFVLKYVCESTASAQWRALLRLRSDSRVFLRQFSAILKERGIYSFTWEVGYAVLP